MEQHSPPPRARHKESDRFSLKSTNDDLEMRMYLNKIAPPLTSKRYKGQGGRIGVLGGSVDYTGAPYYAGMSALRVGAELVSVFTAFEASIPIKSYSPELMVSPVYRNEHITSAYKDKQAAEQHNMVDKVTAQLPRLHALAIGPGLGREPAVLAAVSQIITAASSNQIPLVIDADGLWIINQKPELVKGCPNVVLTPNLMEFRRLAKAVTGTDTATLDEVTRLLNGPIVLQKGHIDSICGFESDDEMLKSKASLTAAPPPPFLQKLRCTEPGCPRRPGGLGDFLAGAVAVLLGWAAQTGNSRMRACYAACTLMKRSCRYAFAVRKRSMTAPDVLEYIGSTFEEMCPASDSMFAQRPGRANSRFLCGGAGPPVEAVVASEGAGAASGGAL